MSQQIQLLQQYVKTLECENQAKNKQRQTLYSELGHLQVALKSLQEEITVLKLNNISNITTTLGKPQQHPQQSSSPTQSTTIQSLKSRIRDLQQQLQILKYQQQHLFQQNLSLITALQGTANHNTQLQKQNKQLKSQKQELQKFRLAIQRISASLQQLESERQQLTQVNMVLVEENSYLKGVLAGSSSSYRQSQRNYFVTNGQQQQQNISSTNTIKNTNTHLPNYPMVKSSYLMSSSFQKISQYQQQYEDSTQGGGSKRKNKLKLSSAKKKPFFMNNDRDTDRENGFMYQHQDHIDQNENEMDDGNVNDQSSYLMVMMDQKSKESLRVSYQMQQQYAQQERQQKNSSQQRDNDNPIRQLSIQDLHISNFDRVNNQHSSNQSSNQKYQPPKLSSRRSPTTNNKNDQSSCDVIQEQLQSQHSHYKENYSNDKNNTNKQMNNQNQFQQDQQVTNYHLTVQKQEQYHHMYHDRIQKLQIRNSQLQAQLTQMRQRFLQIQRQRDSLHEQLAKRQQQEQMTVNWWQSRIQEMTNNYNAVVEHTQQLEEQNVTYKNRIVELEALVKEFNYYKLLDKSNNRNNRDVRQRQQLKMGERSITRTNKNIYHANNFINKNTKQSTRKRFSYHYQQNHHHQTPNGNQQKEHQNYSRPQSVSSMKELRQIDTNEMVDHKSLLKHNNQLIERMTQIQQQKNQLYLNHYQHQNSSQYSIRSDRHGFLRNIPCQNGENDNTNNKENFVMNCDISGENLNQPTYELPKNKRHLSEKYTMSQPIYTDANVNKIMNSSPFERSFTKACKKFNRTNKKPMNSLQGFDDRNQNDVQTSQIQQVENRLQRRIQRIKSQNQLLLKQLQLF